MGETEPFVMNLLFLLIIYRYSYLGWIIFQIRMSFLISTEFSGSEKNRFLFQTIQRYLSSFWYSNVFFSSLFNLDQTKWDITWIDVREIIVDILRRTAILWNCIGHIPEHFNPDLFKQMVNHYLSALSGKRPRGVVRSRFTYQLKNTESWGQKSIRLIERRKLQ